jgi:hypothetical protein
MSFIDPFALHQAFHTKIEGRKNSNMQSSREIPQQNLPSASDYDHLAFSGKIIDGRLNPNKKTGPLDRKEIPEGGRLFVDFFKILWRKAKIGQYFSDFFFICPSGA